MVHFGYILLVFHRLNLIPIALSGFSKGLQCSSPQCPRISPFRCSTFEVVLYLSGFYHLLLDLLDITTVLGVSFGNIKAFLLATFTVLSCNYRSWSLQNWNDRSVNERCDNLKYFIWNALTSISTMVILLFVWKIIFLRNMMSCYSRLDYGAWSHG